MEIEVQKLMNNIREARFYNPEKEYNLCASLEAIARKNRDEYLLANVFLYSGDALLTLGMMENSINTLQKGIEIQERNNYIDLLPLSYNLMGEIYAYLKNEQMALDYFIRALTFLKNDEDYIAKSAVLINIAKLYTEIGIYDKAEELLRRADDVLKRDRRKKHYVEEFYQNDIRLLMTQIRLSEDKFDEAKEYLKKITDKTRMGLDVLMTSALVDVKELKAKVAYKKIKDIIELGKHESKNINLFKVYRQIISSLISLGRVDDIPEIMEDMKRATSNIDIPGIWMEFLDSYIKYCKLIDDREGLKAAYKSYFEWTLIQDRISQTSKLLRLKGRENLYKLMDK